MKKSSFQFGVCSSYLFVILILFLSGDINAQYELSEEEQYKMEMADLLRDAQRAQRIQDNELLDSLNHEVDKLRLKAAQEGHAVFQYDQALFMERNDDYEAAYDWLEKAASQDFAAAHTRLAFYYINGMVVERSMEKAEQLFRKSYKRNDEAVYYLASMYYMGEYLEQDYKKSVEHLMERSVYKWSVDDWDQLVSSQLPVYPERLHVDNVLTLLADHYYDKGNYKVSAEYLFDIYEDSVETPKDLIRDIRRAEQDGNRDLRFALASIFLTDPPEGRMGTDITAFNYLKSLADLGHYQAMYAIGNLYREGVGVTKNLSRAEYWFKKSLEINPDIMPTDLYKLYSAKYSKTDTKWEHAATGGYTGRIYVHPETIISVDDRAYVLTKNTDQNENVNLNYMMAECNGAVAMYAAKIDERRLVFPQRMEIKDGSVLASIKERICQ